MTNAFATARVTDDNDPVEVDLAVKRVARRVVPSAELLDVLEIYDPARIVFTEVRAVQEIDVDGRSDYAVGRQELTEVEIARRRILERLVVAVGEHHQRKGSAPARDADVSV